MKKSNLQRFLIFSVILHCVFAVLLLHFNSEPSVNKNSKTHLWPGAQSYFNLVPFQSSNSLAHTQTPAPQLSERSLPKKTSLTQQPQALNNLAKGLYGEGLDATGSLDPTLEAQIRKKILKHQVMPDTLYSEKGWAKVRFETDLNGALKQLAVIESSGNELINQAALDSVQRAAPLPYIKNPIAIILEYE